MIHHDVALLESPRGTASAPVLPLEERFRRSLPPGATFRNPILPAQSADPWVVQHEGWYYYCESRNQNSIWIRKARNFTDLAHDEGMLVWQAPASGADSKSLWAPELHLLDGKWYIYYAADDGLNENHRMWVLEGVTSNPCGPFRTRGVLDTGGWAIDGTVLNLNELGLFFVWSGWPGKENGRQNLYIAPMVNPWTLAGERVLIAEPEDTWETVDMAICEGPQILQRNGRTFIVYSASGSWTEDYCLGLLELTGRSPLLRSSWKKQGCVFQKNDSVWGLGHCSFVQSPDRQEDWIVYHAKSKRKKGWTDRNVRTQKFSWTDEGLPIFGEPIGAGVSLNVPSGAVAQIGL